jgi:hypothetical protein
VTYAVTLQGYPEGIPGAIQITGGIDGQVSRGQGDQGDESANASVSITSFAVTLGPMPQHITFTSSPPNPVFYGDTYTVSATGGGSGNPVTFSVGSSPGCTISGSTVTIVSADGYCEIEANQAGNAEYAPAPTAYQVVAAVPEPTTTTLSLTSPITYDQEGQEVLAVHVSAAHGLPLPESATFQVTTTSINLCSGTLDASTGNGQCTMAPSALEAGSYSVYAGTLGSQDLAGSTSEPASLVVKPAPTTLIASPVTYTQGLQGWTATFTARLVDASSGQPIGREDVSFTVQGPLDSGTFDAITNDQGYAIRTYHALGLEPLNGGSQYRATFNGSNDYLSSNATGSISLGT